MAEAGGGEEGDFQLCCCAYVMVFGKGRERVEGEGLSLHDESNTLLQEILPCSQRRLTASSDLLPSSIVF